MEQKPLGGPLGKMNLTNHAFQGSSENITTSTPGPTLHSSLDTAATAVLGSIGVVALILLLVGLLSVTLKKWRHERLFKKQQKHQTNFLHKPLELSCHADAIYSNVINLAPRKEDDFAVYANVPPFNRPRRTSPDHVEYASIDTAETQAGTRPFSWSWGCVPAPWGELPTMVTRAEATLGTISLIHRTEIQKLEPGERKEKYSPAAETAQEF
ncbi:hypothetical protein CapIbe_014167 [Capra ibex]